MIISGHIIRSLRIITPFHDRSKAFGMTFGVGPAGYDVRVAQKVELLPGGFMLVSTIEHFRMPSDLLGTVRDKSTLARMGLAVQNTIIEPGWRGHLTLELSNHGLHGIVLEKGSPIAQVTFERIEGFVDLYKGKYQDQGPEPTPPILE